MNIIQFIFLLIDSFVPIEAREYAKMKFEGENWWKSIQYYQQDDENANTWRNQLKTHSEKWYIKLALAVLYLFLYRWLAIWMSGAKQQENTHSEQTDN